MRTGYCVLAIVAITLAGFLFSLSKVSAQILDSPKKQTKVESNQEKQRGSSNEDKNEKLTQAEKQIISKVFAGRLLEIAEEYKSYERVDQKMRWAPALCALPPEPPKDRGLISQSKSKTTHGQKLYFLYARKAWQYKSNVWGLSTSKTKRAPLGQVLVKEAWEPLEVDLKKSKLNGQSDKPKKEKDIVPFATHRGKRFHAGAKKGLFVMFKTDESTPGTDQGWVYGTVSADGKTVKSVGKVSSCIQCHKSAPFDRQIGLKGIFAN